jgi:hypothetical protein
MSAASNESGATSGRESDSERIERIAAYVREQRRADRSWTASLGRFTTYLALAAFFFGVGTLADLRNRVAAPPPAAAQAARDGYVRSLDGYCRSLVTPLPSGSTATGWARIAADDLEVLTGRNRMNLAWNTFAIPGSIAADDIGTLESIKSYHFAANDFLQAAIGRARAADADGYSASIGQYRQANAAFLKAASDFGFTVCNHYWTVDDAPPPNR